MFAQLMEHKELVVEKKAVEVAKAKVGAARGKEAKPTPA